MSRDADQIGSPRVARVRPRGAVTELLLASGDCCVVPATPDPDAALRLRRGFSRLGSVRIDVGVGRPRASVLGSARHVPMRRPVPLATAVSLAVEGVPTTVHRHLPTGPGSAP